MTTEKPIPGFPGYLITPDGKVFRTKRGNSARRQLSPFYVNSRSKQLVVDLYQNGLRQRRSIQSLVYDTFHAEGGEW